MLRSDFVKVHSLQGNSVFLPVSVCLSAETRRFVSCSFVGEVLFWDRVWIVRMTV